MGEWLATFLMNPALGIGSAAVASPILIHLLSKRRYQRIRWAAMDFLLDAQRKNRRRVKIEQLILLALRCLAALLIALLVARPFVRTSAVGAILGARARTERIVLIDDSFSMGYRLPGGETVFSQAIGAARQIAKWASTDTPADTLTVLVTSRPRQSLVALPSLSDENIRRLDDHLATLASSQTAAHFPEAAAAVAELIRKMPTQANTAVYVISDFQRIDWLKPASSDAVSPAMASVAALQGRQSPVKLTLVDVAAESPRNIAITDLKSLQPQIVAGVPARFEVAVTNFSPSPLDHVELAIGLSQHTLPAIEIPKIQPGQAAREPIEVTFPQEGPDYLRIGLAGTAAGGDSLVLDNSRAAAVEVVSAVDILVVDGEPSTDPFRDEVHLLKTALRPSGRAASGNEVTVVTEQELDAAEWSRYHLVVLANVARLSPASLQGLENFVQSGGGLIIYAGDQVDAAYYNRDLYKENRGLLPATIGDVTLSPANAPAIHIADWDVNHPIFRAFGGPLAAVLRQVRVGAFVSLSSESEHVAATAPASMPAEPLVLARYDDAKQSPAILLRPYGRGTVVLVTTSADQEWNDWGANFSYVPLVLELAAYTARSTDAPSQSLVGDSLSYVVDPAALKSVARLRSPGYPVDPEIPLAARVEQGKPPRFEHADVNKSGIWTFELSAVSGETVECYAAVNLDPNEANPAHATRAELDAALAGMKFDYVRDLSVFTRDTASARQELWWPILLAVVAVLMTEHWLAWFFGTRG